MKKIIIACRTIEDELSKVLEETDEKIDIRYFEGGLHDMPNKLKERLQEEIDGISGVDCVLLGMGTCGNSVVGVRNGDFKLILPRTDDCISILMGSISEKKKYGASCFYTAGWLRKARNLREEFLECLDKYGEELGIEIYSMMLEHYKYLSLVDTGCYDMTDTEEKLRPIAEALELELKTVTGTLDYLRDFINENWDRERFIMIEPGQVITEKDCEL